MSNVNSQMSLAEKIRTYMPNPKYMICEAMLPTENNGQKSKDIWKKAYVNFAQLDEFLSKFTPNQQCEYHFKPLLDSKECGEYVFVNKLNDEKLAIMKNDGIYPCLVVEARPQEYQVWIRFKNLMDGETIRETCRYLVHTYNLDMGAIMKSHFGIFPETYRKLENGQSFWVKIVEMSDAINQNIELEEDNRQGMLFR